MRGLKRFRVIGESQIVVARVIQHAFAIDHHRRILRPIDNAPHPQLIGLREFRELGVVVGEGHLALSFGAQRRILQWEEARHFGEILRGAQNDKV